MEKTEETQLKTERGHEVSVKFELVPADQKWVALMSGELNNAATYFSPFADVGQDTKNTMDGSIDKVGGTWQPWHYKRRLEMVKQHKLLIRIYYISKLLKASKFTDMINSRRTQP